MQIPGFFFGFMRVFGVFNAYLCFMCRAPEIQIEIPNRECYNIPESIVGVDVCEKEILSFDPVRLDTDPAERLL